MSIGQFRANAFPPVRMPVRPTTIDTQPVKILVENPRRIGTIFDNRGPGIVYASTDKSTATIAAGIKIPVDSILEDDWPPAHIGEWWAVSDAAGTTLLVGESTC